MFERMFREGRDYQWRMDTIVTEAQRAAAEWTFGYTVSAAVPRSEGRSIRFRGMSLFEIEGGRIAAYREYADTGVALLQLGFKPEALAKVMSKRLPADFSSLRAFPSSPFSTSRPSGAAALRPMRWPRR